MSAPELGMTFPAPDWPSHLTRPSADGWCFWKLFGLRSAGIPAHEVLRLGDEALAHAADALTDGRERRDGLARAAKAFIEEALREVLMRHGVRGPNDAPTSALPAVVSTLRRAEGALRRGDWVEELRAVLPGSLGVELRAAAKDVEGLERDYREAYAVAQRSAADVIRDVAAQPLFREAVTWQNHPAIATSLDPISANVAMAGAKRKKREDLVARYLQRYSVKNETIGFFGPISWGHVATGKAGLLAEPSERLLARRNLYFEDWPVAVLADVVATDPHCLPWLTPTLVPFVRLDGDRLHFPGGASRVLPEAERQVLAACDGRRRVTEVVDQLLDHPFPAFATADDVHASMRRLEREGRLDIAFQVPSVQPRPELWLRQQFERIGDEGLRITALAKLDRLEAARADVAAVAGDAEDLGRALGRMDETFEALTGAAARRRPGEAYAGRALLYEDCVRATKVELGGDLLLELQTSLDLMLQSARWFTQAAARRYAAELRTIFDRLAASGRTGAVYMPTLWLHAQALFFEGNAPVADEGRELSARWTAILGPCDGARHVDVKPEDIREAVQDAFASPGSAWRAARYQSPDIMIWFEPDVADGAGRRMRAVLGEIHVGGNTLLANGLVWQHDCPDEIFAGRRADLGRGVVPKLSSGASRQPIRTQYADDAAYGTEVLFSRGARPTDPSTAKPMAALDIVDREGVLWAAERGGTWACELLELLGDFIFQTVASEFRMLPRARHMPRVTVGAVVWQRESWRRTVDELSLLLSDDEEASFLALRQAAAAWGFPRHTFVRVPWEKKPFLLDLASTMSVRALAKHLRSGLKDQANRPREVAFSEMLPAFEHLWLADAAGRTYTSELRMVALHESDVLHQQR